jgi:hypothetical protein
MTLVNKKPDEFSSGFLYLYLSMPDLIYITDEWSEQKWVHTGGTRAKKFLQSPDGRYYYFKQSQKKEPTPTKPGKDYKYEFWNEIIAYELAKMIGFSALKYDIAIYGDFIGCLSELMIDSEKNELVEGVKYLQAYSPLYDPQNKEHKKRYTFHLIKRALESQNLEKHMIRIIELIIFDSIIGNGDRHQENWAFIIEHKRIDIVIDEMEQNPNFKKLKFWEKALFNFGKRTINKGLSEFIEGEKPIPKQYYTQHHRFAPIYDSGSSLGRELSEEKVNEFIMNETDIQSYITKGKAEIHWNGEKLSHFDLIDTIIRETQYIQEIRKVVARISSRFDYEKLRDIVFGIDSKIPERYFHYKIPQNRKELILKIITLRLEKLKEVVL